jgi:hypothetical protein
MTRRHALADNATPEEKEDWEICKRALKIGDGKIPRRAHEQFANQHVQFFREGRAPSPELASVFTRFRNWLLSLYQTVKELGKPITPELRSMFERWYTVEPEPTVIAPARERGPSLATIHETDAAETAPEHADAAMSRVESEATQHEAEPPTPEIAHEIAPVIQAIEAVKQAEQQAGGGEQGPGGGPAAGAEPGGPAGERPEPAGNVGAGGGEPGPVAGGGGVGEGNEPVVGGGEHAGGQGDSVPRPESGSGGRSESGSDPRLGAAPEPVDTLPDAESKFVDKAGNIRLDNVNTIEDFKQALRDIAKANDGFLLNRRDVVTDGQVLDAAQALLGREPDFLERKQIGDAFSAEEIKATEILVTQALRENHGAMQRAAASQSDEDALAYAQSKLRVQLYQSYFSQATAEGGRALRALRKTQDLWSPEIETAAAFAKKATGTTLYQLKQEAKMGAALETTEQVAKFNQDSLKRSFPDMVLEYWVNGLISGPATHVTYSIGNAILAAVKAGPETLAAAAIGEARARIGQTRERVYAGEVGAQFRGAARGFAPALKAAADAFRTGVTTKLPGEKGSGSLPFQPDSSLAEHATLDETANFHDAVSASFGILRGIRDGMLAGGALLKAGGVEGAPTWGAQYSTLGSIPDIAYRGVRVGPLGTMARAPSRFIASIHSFFRGVNYSMQKAALAYRMGTAEGLTGEDLAARVGDLYTNPTEAMMKDSAHEATELTMMGQGSAFTRQLSRLTNTPVFGIKLLKFVDPFVHIASNVIDQSIVQRTPLGVLSPQLRADLMGRNGDIAQDRAQARMLVGSALAMGFGGLAASGYISGSGPSDPRQAAMWRQAGNQAHSVRIGDTWYDMHRLGPMGMLLSISADLYSVAHAADQGDLMAAASMLQHAVTQNILDESFMRGPADLIKAIEDPGRYGEAYLRNWGTSFLPYSVGMAQMARAMDPYTRETRTFMDAIKAKIPGQSEDLYPRRDVWGEPMPSREALVAPGVTSIYESQMSRDPVNLSMLALGIAPGGLEHKIRNVDLDEGQYDDFSRIAGRMTKMRLDAIVRYPAFASWPGNVRHDVMTEIIRQCRETARNMILMKYPEVAQKAYQLKMQKRENPPGAIE